jgi:hypothetical protein
LDHKPDFRLEIGEDPEFQRRFWRIQNAGLIFMGLFLLAGLLGVFGGAGPLASTTSASEQGELTISHPRFLRNRAPIDLEIHLQPDTLQQSRAEIEVDLVYIQQFDILNINPEPSSMLAGSESVTYVFDLVDTSQSMHVTFHMQPERPGLVTGKIGIAGEPAIEFRQLIYP